MLSPGCCGPNLNRPTRARTSSLGGVNFPSDFSVMFPWTPHETFVVIHRLPTQGRAPHRRTTFLPIRRAQAMLQLKSSPGSQNGTGLLQTVIAMKADWADGAGADDKLGLGLRRSQAIHPTSDGLQPQSDGLQPDWNGGGPSMIGEVDCSKMKIYVNTFALGSREWLLSPYIHIRYMFLEDLYAD